MVNQQLCVDPKQLIEQILVLQGAAGNIAHGIDAMGLQLSGVPAANPPEIGEGPVLPQQAAVGALVQLGDADAVDVRVDVLRNDIHSDLAEIEVAPDPSRGGDACSLQHIRNDLTCQFSGIELVGIQVIGHIHQDLINRIVVDIFLGDVFQIYVVNPGAPFHVMGHPGRGHDIVHSETGVGF